jgi:hypothetical protein
MPAIAEPIYLPILSPASRGVGLRTLLEQRAPARQSRQPRVYRAPSRPADEGIVYGPDGTLTKSQGPGLEIDLFV